MFFSENYSSDQSSGNWSYELYVKLKTCVSQHGGVRGGAGRVARPPRDVRVGAQDGRRRPRVRRHGGGRESGGGAGGDPGEPRPAEGPRPRRLRRGARETGEGGARGGVMGAGALEEVLQSPDRLKDLDLDAFAEELERQVRGE